MAQRALPPGAIRRRAAFGLLDADGWTWAGLRAGFWFLMIVFMLGYIPNLAYYFTVSNTVDVGYNFISVVNWCPADNEDLPCPAPNGAVLPWQASPSELALPSGRAGAGAFQSGTHLYLIGGETEEGATAEVLTTEASLDGNFAPWTAGPALPEPRSDTAVSVFLGVPYVLGGLDASGQPTDTAFRGIVEDGALTGWEAADGSASGVPDLRLPRAVSAASIVASPSGFVLVGGLDAEGQPVPDVHTAWVDEAGTQLGSWEAMEGLALPEPRAGAVAGSIGDFVYVVGGLGPEGATRTVFRLELADREPAVDETGQVRGWVVAPELSRLPEPRSHAVSYASSGSIYVIGGLDGEGDPQQTSYWAVADPLTGDFDTWQRLDQTDLPQPVARAPIAAVASTAFIFGGVGEEGLSDASMRAGLAPRAPFFQLGIAGATIPALSIKGEVGQQLGYLNAMGVGTVNFVVLVLVALAFSHPDATRRLITRLSRGRLRAPRREEYGPS